MTSGTWMVQGGTPPTDFPAQTTPALSGTEDTTTGIISGTLSLPQTVEPPTEGQTTTFSWTEATPGSATGSINSNGDVTLSDSLNVVVNIEPLGETCTTSTPFPVSLHSTSPYDSSTGNVTLTNQASFTIPNFSTTNCTLAAGELSAQFSGSTGNALVLSLEGTLVEPAPPTNPSTTTLSASPDSPQAPGTSVTFSATVAPTSGTGPTPTGTVNFVENGGIIGTGALTSGTATYTTTDLQQTTSQLTAVYSGDSNYSTSTSNTLPYTIQALPTISSTFPSQLVAGGTTFPTPTPFTLTVSDPAGGATYTDNLFMYLGIFTHGGLAASDIELSYEDEAGNWCPLTLSNLRPPTGAPNLPTTTAPATYFGGLGTPPCGFASAFSLDPGTSVTFNMEISLDQAKIPNDPFAGPFYLTSAVETGSCTSSSSCSAVAPLSGATAVTSQALSTVLPPGGPGTVPTTITNVGLPGSVAGETVRSGFGIYANVSVKNTSTKTIYTNSYPSGTVQWFVDGQLTATNTLKASTGLLTSFTLLYTPPSALAPGTHTETMNYLGDLTFAPSTLSQTFTVIAGPPTGTPFVCSIVDTSGDAIGSVNAYVTATATGLPTAATAGTSVTASNVSVTLDMDAAATNGDLAMNNGQAGQTIGFSPGTGTVDAGPVTFALNSDGTDLLGTWSGLSTTVQVTGGTGSTVPIGVSSISFNWGFSGNVSCTPVSQPAIIGTVGIIGTALAVSPLGSAPVGAPVTLTATVSPLPPPATGIAQPPVPGQVDFFDGSTYLGTASVDPTAGTASFITSALSVGDHQLSAVWSGYSGVPPSTSNTVDYQVGTATTTALASSASPANAANPVTFTATVSPPDGATTQPTGDVSFTSDGNAISGCDNQPLSMASPPTATCTTSFGAGQSHSIVATYGGDATYLGSASDPLTQKTLAGTNTSILSTKDPSPPGNVTFWSGVSPSSGTGATPTGTVAFSIDGSVYKPCASQPIGSGGGASCTVSFKAGTTHKVFATYPGSATYSGSKSNTITQTVTGAEDSTGPKDTGGSATLNPGQSLTAGQSIATDAYKLAMQSDGNLVEYQGSKALWASHTAGHPGTGVVMRKDGNLVEYFHGHAIWSSKTAGHAGSHLTLQAKDGNVVIYTPANKAAWSTGT